MTEQRRDASHRTHPQTSPNLYFALTLTAAATAAIAAFVSLSLALPLWAMFTGWVAYFTRRPSIYEGAQSLVCLIIGLVLGCVAATLIRSLAPAIGTAAFPLVVFIIATVVIAARGLPVLNNLLGYFVGLITFFASHLEPSVEAVGELGGASTIGAVAGWLAHTTDARIRCALAA